MGQYIDKIQSLMVISLIATIVQYCSPIPETDFTRIVGKVHIVLSAENEHVHGLPNLIRQA